MALKQKPIVSNDETIKALLQKQVDHEFDNERLYLSMSLWCEDKGYIQTAKFFSEHSLEERDHGMGFINFMLKKGMRVETPYTTGVPREFDDLKDVLVQSVTREKETSEMIAELYKVSIEHNSLASTVAKHYLDEQVEEEQLFVSLLNLYRLCNGSKIDFEMEVNSIKKSGKYSIGKL